MNKRQAKKNNQMEYGKKYRLQRNNEQLMDYALKIVETAQSNKVGKIHISRGTAKVLTETIQNDKIVIEVPINTSLRLIANSIIKTPTSVDPLQVVIVPKKKPSSEILQTTTNTNSSLKPMLLKSHQRHLADSNNKSTGDGDGDGDGTGTRHGITQY